MEESISAAPNTLEGDGGEVLVKVQSQKDSEMYRIAKVKCTTVGYHHTGLVAVVVIGGGGWWGGGEKGSRMWDYE